LLADALLVDAFKVSDGAMLARSVVVFSVSIACDVVDGLVVGTKSTTDSFASMAPAREGASSDSGCIAVAERESVVSYLKSCQPS
jgi:hypothetical protein